MRNGIVYVDKKKVDLDKADMLYADGQFRGSRGVGLYRTKKGSLVWLNWTNWQGEDDKYKFVTKEEALDLLQNSPHPERVAEAIEKLDIDLEEA